MKKIEAFINHSRLLAVKDALSVLGVAEMSAKVVNINVRASSFGNARHGLEHTCNQQPESKVEFFVPNALAGEAITTLVNSAGIRGNIPAHVFMSSVDELPGRVGNVESSTAA